MNDFQSYEKIVKLPNKGIHLFKKISLAMGYAVFFVIWLAAALNNISKAVYLIAAGLLCTVIIAAITWKYLCVEYEYSFSYGILSVSKIYGKRKRKELLNTQMKELLIVASATEENMSRAERFEIEERIVAVSTEGAESIWFAVTGGKDEKRIMVFFEADERSLGILRAANPYVFVKSK